VLVCLRTVTLTFFSFTGYRGQGQTDQSAAAGQRAKRDFHFIPSPFHKSRQVFLLNFGCRFSGHFHFLFLFFAVSRWWERDGIQPRKIIRAMGQSHDQKMNG
jgi:hypothetical protein